MIIVNKFNETVVDICLLLESILFTIVTYSDEHRGRVNSYANDAGEQTTTWTIGAALKTGLLAAYNIVSSFGSDGYYVSTSDIRPRASTRERLLACCY
jgi:hypothetical protein